MRFSSPIPRHHVGRTFIVAISILGVVALAQLASVGWAVFSKRHRPPIVAATDEPTLAEAEQLDMSDTFAEPQPTATPAKVVSLPKPTPIAKIRRDAGPTGRVQEILAQARALRERGDTSTALTRLREGHAIAPANPVILSEMAITYEKMGLTDKAAEHWRRIYELGESAGIYFTTAEAKLQNLQTPATAESFVKDGEGFQPGAVLSVADVTMREQADESAFKHLNLRVAIKAKQDSEIDVHDVVIQVFFYDMVDNNIVQTNANVSSHWSTLPPNWTDSDIEVLEVEYVQPKPEKNEGQPLENRNYFGYVVRVYYKNVLQDMRAEPIRLLKQHPPPLTLQVDEMR
jgi:hypothetical protein